MLELQYSDIGNTYIPEWAQKFYPSYGEDMESSVMIPEMAFTPIQLYRRLASGVTKPPFYTSLYNDVLYVNKRTLKLVPATVTGYVEFTKKLTLQIKNPSIQVSVNTLNLSERPAINFKSGTRVSVIVGKSTTSGKYNIVGLYTPAPILRTRVTTGKVTKIAGKKIQVSYSDPWDKQKYSKMFATPSGKIIVNSPIKVTVNNMAPRIATIGQTF